MCLYDTLYNASQRSAHTFCRVVAVVGVPTASELSNGDLEAPALGGGLGLDPVFQVWSNLWNSGLTGEQQEYYNLSKVCSCSVKVC